MKIEDMYYQLVRRFPWLWCHNSWHYKKCWYQQTFSMCFNFKKTFISIIDWLLLV